MKNFTVEHIINDSYGAYKRKGWTHYKCRLRYHIIFSTKYRKKCLTDIKQQVFDAFNYCNNRSEFNILNMNLDKDHIHFYVEIPPTISIGQCVNRMKAISTNYLWDRYSSYLSQFYWGKKRKLWTNGYFCSSIGLVSEQIVWNYINNQS